MPNLLRHYPWWVRLAFHLVERPVLVLMLVAGVGLAVAGVAVVACEVLP